MYRYTRVHPRTNIVYKKRKSGWRLTISDDRLNDLMVIDVESKNTRHLDLDEVINKFSSIKTRRYPLQY